MASYATPQEIMTALIEGRKPTRTTKNVITAWDGNQPAIYSYGDHFPMAVKDERGYWVNESKYSPTTTRHQKGVQLALLYAGYAPTIETKPDRFRGWTMRLWTKGGA